MTGLWGWLGVDNVALTVLGYPLSWVELLGTVLYAWSVWLISRRRLLTWPVGIASVLLYLALFLQIGLYSDALEQVYYLAMSVYGWATWKAARGPDKVEVRWSPGRQAVAVAGTTLVLGGVLGLLMSNVHRLWAVPPADFPYLDAVTTMMSFTAMWLLARRRAEAWVYWIIVDVIAIGLYWVKDVRFLALLYVVLLAMAVMGLLGWRRSAASRQADAARTTRRGS